MISTLISAGRMPSTLLAVDGSKRTLTCVVVIPSTGAMVGERVDGIGVWDGSSVEPAGKVDVWGRRVGVGVIPPWFVELQLLLKSAKEKATNAAVNRMNTMKF